MKNRLMLSLLASVLVLTGIPNPLSAENIPSGLDSLILAAKGQLYRLDLINAEKRFIEAQKRYPDFPHGFVYQAYINVLIFGLDMSNDSLDTILKSQMDLAADKANEYRGDEEDVPERYFYVGLGNSIKGIYHVINRNYVRGYWYGRKAKNSLNKTIELDPEYYDTYLGLGVVHYYADLLPGVIKFLAGVLGFDGDRELGMKEIVLARDKGHFFRVESEFVYNSIKYFLEGERSVGAGGFRSMYSRYPENDALALMIAYHHRRRGELRRCLDYCERVDDSRYMRLPQIPNLKYYNMALASYDLNRFAEADSLFDVLVRLPTRKSRYYLAAIDYYKGHLADLQFKRAQALAYYDKIEKHDQTKYWYWISRAPQRFAIDSLMFQFFSLRNKLYNREYRQSLPAITALYQRGLRGEPSTNPDFHLLAEDLLAENYYYLKRLSDSRRLYAGLMPRIEKNMEDEFRRAWAYIHYARVLRSAKEFELSAQMLEKARRLDDDYTRLVISREEFILKKRRDEIDEPDD